MTPLMLILTAITVTLIAAVMASVVKGKASLERQRLAHNERAAYLRAQRGKPAGRAPRRRQVGAGAPRPAIGAGTGQKPALPATTTAQERPADLPPLGARIRLDDGRTGTVAAIERIAGATRVHLELDGGGRGHVDIPDAARPAPVAQPEPAPPTPAPQPRPTPATPTAPPARPAAVPAPAAAMTAATGRTTVRLGGFSMPITHAGGRS